MRSLLLVLLLWGGLAGLAHADVVRCTDAAGRVSYTDGACPAGSKQTGNVPVPEAGGPYERTDRAAQAQMDSVTRARQLQRETADTVTHSPQSAPAGVSVIDARGGPSRGEDNELAAAPRDSHRGEGSAVADTWYPPGAGGYRWGAPPRDMRPRIRSCDANGCNDTLGNHYNRQGRIDRYQREDGKTCRQINSTQICR